MVWERSFNFEIKLTKACALKVKEHPVFEKPPLDLPLMLVPSDINETHLEIVLPLLQKLKVFWL